jgi:hypothetical protein
VTELAVSSSSGAPVVPSRVDLDRIDVGGDQLSHLAASWLLGYNSPHTRRTVEARA